MLFFLFFFKHLGLYTRFSIFYFSKLGYHTIVQNKVYYKLNLYISFAYLSCQYII